MSRVIVGTMIRIIVGTVIGVPLMVLFSYLLSILMLKDHEILQWGLALTIGPFLITASLLGVPIGIISFLRLGGSSPGKQLALRIVAGSCFGSMLSIGYVTILWIKQVGLLSSNPLTGLWILAAGFSVAIFCLGSKVYFVGILSGAAAAACTFAINIWLFRESDTDGI